MSNFKDDILDAAGDEPIEAIVIGYSLIRDSEQVGQLLSWEEALPYLDYEYYTDYGSPDCNPITAWTSSKIIFVAEYDGSTSVSFVYRNPTPHMPTYP